MSVKRTRQFENMVMLIALLILIGLLFFSCKTADSTIQHRVDSVYIQKLVPVTLPADTASLKALLACNAQGKVTFSRLQTETTKNARLTFLLDSLGELQVETVVKHDTIYVKADSVWVKGTITQWKIIEKPLGKWDSFILRFGNWMFGGLCATIAAIFIYFITKFRIN